MLTVSDMRSLAMHRLPRALFDVIDGGADDELTMRANCAAYDSVQFRPRALADVSSRDLTTTVLGQPISMPVMLAPCGGGRLIHRDGELAAARAAGQAGTIYALSTMSSFELERVAEVAQGPLWYQLYMMPERKTTEEIVDRVRAAGFAALCVTIDGAMNVSRPRDFRNGLTIPYGFSPRLLSTALNAPDWAWDFVRGRVARGAAFRGPKVNLREVARKAEYFKSVTFDDLCWLRDRWQGPLVIKGVQRADECDMLIEAGVDGIVVSNHGGRNLDGVPATLEILSDVVDVVGGRAEVFVDGGVRRGSDVLKALALGARACLVGRPYMYGLAAGGESGVARVLEILRAEFDRTLGLVGCTSSTDVDAASIDCRMLGLVGQAPLRSQAALVGAARAEGPVAY